MAGSPNNLIGSTSLAARLGVSPSTIKFWERTGVIAPARRIEGSNRRVYFVADVEVIREQAARRRDRRQTAIAR
jgi:DNA-binding transcriptional MerR regulator